MKKMLAMTGVLFALAACGSDTLSRDEAIDNIQSAVPGATRSDAGRLIDFVCDNFKEGRGGRVITEKANVPEEERETFSYVILKAAQSECPDNIVDAQNWREHNGWN